MNNLWRTEDKSQSSFIFKENEVMNKKVINKAKETRRSHKAGELKFLRYTGVKRKHAFYHSYRKHMNKKAYYKMTISKILPWSVIIRMREQLLYGSDLDL